MTKQIADSLGMTDLDRVKKALKQLQETEEAQNQDPSDDELNTAIQEYQQLDASLPAFADPDFDNEMDEIAKDANNACKDLLELGFDVETKYTAEIVSAAERFKSTELSALKAKAERKLKMIDLKLKERRLDLLEQKQNATLSNGTIDGDGEYLDDRESILDD